MSRLKTYSSLDSRLSPGGSKKWTNSMNSGGLKAWMCTLGQADFICDKRFSYHSRGSSGFIPPCMRICVPPMASSSRVFPMISSAERV